MEATRENYSVEKAVDESNGFWLWVLRLQYHSLTLESVVIQLIMKFEKDKKYVYYMFGSHTEPRDAGNYAVIFLSNLSAYLVNMLLSYFAYLYYQSIGRYYVILPIK